MRRATLWFVLIVGLIGGALVSAQGSELLTNPGLEEGSFGPFTTRRGGEFPIYLPNGWNIWLAGPTGEFFNRSDRTSVNAHPGPGPSPHEGSRAVNIDCGFVTCTASIYQQVNVAPASNVQASAWAQVKACNVATGSNSCGSAVESGAQTRIGIDPNGGTDPNDTDVVWSGWVQPHDQWLQMSVSATTSGTTATLFLYSTQGSTAQINKTYWDHATLTGGGSGGAVANSTQATAVPTAPPEVAFVVPQNEQADGSIIHTVQGGDTLDSIAVAYGVTRQHILDLNNISDPRIISIGQEIKIRDALPTSGTSFTEELPDATEAVGAEGTQEPGAESTDENVPESTEEVSGDGQTPVGLPTIQPTSIAQESSSVGGNSPSAPVVSAANGDVLPASDSLALTSAVCVLLFNDVNQNRIQEQDETLLPGGSINLNIGTEPTATVETDGVSEPHCFEGLAAGQYMIAASAPAGYGLTSPDQLRLDLLPGTTLDVSFGAAEGVVAAVPPPADTAGIVNEVRAEEPDTRSSVDQLLNISGLVIFGLAAVVLVAGIGLTLFMRRR